MTFSIAQIFPKNNIVKNVGDHVQMWCTSKDPSKYLSFYNASVELPKENMKIVNETTIELNLYNVTTMDVSVTCKFNGSRGEDMRRIIVGTPPKEIEDFRCLSYDFNYFECKFTMPTNFVKVKYNITYSVGFSPLIYYCPKGREENNKYICNITIESGKYRQVHDEYTFKIHAENKLGNRTFVRVVKHYEMVIPGKPMLKVTNISTNSARMEWDVMKTFYSRTGLVFEIDIVSRYNASIRKPWEKLDTSRIKSISETKYSFNLVNLYPYMLYEVKLRLKVANAANISEMWTAVNEQFRTKSKKPDNPPAVDVGSFLKQSTYNTSATWFIIYWKGLEEYEKNADGLSYVLTKALKNGKEVDIQPKENTSYSAKFVLDEKADYEFTLHSSNVEGLSKEGSVISVPKREYPAPHLKKIYKEMSYILSWDEPNTEDDLEIENYTVFSCEAASETFDQCKSNLNFTHVSRNVRNFTYMMNTQEKMNFAVSANYYGGGSSGMIWALCTASANSDFGIIKPKGLPQHGNTIKLYWNVECVYSTMVEGFRLNYCPIAVNNASCKEPLKSLNISGSIREYYLTNLKAYTTYGIWMSMYSAKKQGPEDYTPLEITTLESAPSPPRRLTALNKTDHSIELQWEAPEFHNGILTYYKIYYDNERENITATNETKITWTIKRLSSYKNYKIYVTASTTTESEASNDISVRTLIGSPSTTDQVNIITDKDSSAVTISWKRPQVPSGPIDFYELKVSIFERGNLANYRISQINGTKCTMKQFHDNICRNNWEKIEFEVRAVNAIPSEYGEVPDSFSEEYPGTLGNHFRCQEESSFYQYNTRYLKGEWSTKLQQMCYYSASGIPNTLIIISIFTFIIFAVSAYFLSKKYMKMKDIGITFPPGLTDLDQESGPKGCDNVISRDESIHSEESLYKNENHKLLESNRMDSGYTNGFDRTEKSDTGEFDDSSIDAIRGEEDSSSRHAESVEMSDMSDSMSNSPIDSPNMNIRENNMPAPIAQISQPRPLKKPIIINGYVQHDSFQSFAEPTIPYTSLDEIQNTIIPINMNAATDSNGLSKHKDPVSMNTGAQENICGYVTHKQLSEFGHRQQ